MHDNVQIQNELIQLFKNSEICERLLEDDIEYMIDRSSEVRFSKNGIVFRAGEKSKRFYIVRSGSVSVSNGDTSSETARFIVGDVIGDYDFAINGLFDATAITLESTVLLAFPSPSITFDDIANEKPDTAARIMLSCLGIISSRLRQTQKLISENAPWVRELRNQIYTDSGTGLFSISYFEEEIPRLKTENTALIFIKPDRFKELNDACGHQAGDEVMNKLAFLLKLQVKTLNRGWAVRLRSNECVLVLPDYSLNQAADFAKEIATLIKKIDLTSLMGKDPFSLTSSISVSVWPQDGNDWKHLSEHAYGVLIRAWRDGGDRVYHAKLAKKMETKL